MQLITHLSFDGQTAEALRYYQHCLGGEISVMMTYAESPLAEMVSSDWRDKILHATFTFSGQTLMASDPPPDQYQTPQGFSIALNLDDPAEADRLFNTLADGGEILMPLTETFWALKYGIFVDRFGTPWMVNCSRPEATA
jgi:PhnB protein